MHPQVLLLSGQIEEAVRGLDFAALLRHPEGKWCSAEILEHLSMTYGGTAKALHRSLDSGERNLAPASLKQKLSTFVVCGLGYLPSGRKSPDMVVPKGLAPDVVLAQIRDNLLAMDAAIAASEKRWGVEKIATHPVLGPLTAKQWRRFHQVHGKLHVGQIFALREWMAANPASQAAQSKP